MTEKTQLQTLTVAKELEEYKMAAEQERNQLIQELEGLKKMQAQAAAEPSVGLMPERQSVQKPPVQHEAPRQLLIQSDYIPSGKPLQPRVDRGPYDMTLDDMGSQPPVGKDMRKAVNQQETVTSNPNQ